MMMVIAFKQRYSPLSNRLTALLSHVTLMSSDCTELLFSHTDRDLLLRKHGGGTDTEMRVSTKNVEP